MAVLTETKLTKRRPGERYTFPLKAATTIHGGALVALDAGVACPGRTAAGLVFAGVAESFASNVAPEKATTVEVLKGEFCFNNDGSVNRTHIGSPAYAVDDQTLAATAGGTRSATPPITDVTAEGVWVKF